MAANGNKARQKRAKTGKAPIAKNPENGQFLPGNNGGGRPKGSLDFMAIAREKAKETGESLRDMAWDVLISMRNAAIEGDVAAANLVLNRLCGALEKSPLVAVQINNGPPLPEAREWAGSIKAFVQAAESMGLLEEKDE